MKVFVYIKSPVNILLLTWVLLFIDMAKYNYIFMHYILPRQRNSDR